MHVPAVPAVDVNVNLIVSPALKDIVNVLLTGDDPAPVPPGPTEVNRSVPENREPLVTVNVLVLAASPEPMKVNW